MLVTDHLASLPGSFPPWTSVGLGSCPPPPSFCCPMSSLGRTIITWLWSVLSPMLGRTVSSEHPATSQRTIDAPSTKFCDGKSASEASSGCPSIRLSAHTCASFSMFRSLTSRNTRWSTAKSSCRRVRTIWSDWKWDSCFHFTYGALVLLL